MTNKLDKLLAKQEQLANQIKQEEAKERGRQRKLETRRKILLGSLVEVMMNKDASLRADIESRLESFLTRAVDREAFNLPVEKTDPSQASNSEKVERESAA